MKKYIRYQYTIYTIRRYIKLISKKYPLGYIGMLYMILCDRVLLRHLMTSRDTHFGYWLVSYRSVRFCQSTGLQPAGSRRNEICTKSAAFTVRSGRTPASHSKAPNCSEDFTCAMGSSHSGHPWRHEWLWSHTLTSWCGSQYCFCLYA